MVRLAAAALALSATPLAAQTCSNAPILMICSASCSNQYCGWNLPLAGKKFAGKYVVYRDRGKADPIVIPPGQNEARENIRFEVPTEDSSLHYMMDETPDFALYISVRQAGGPFAKEFRGASNERHVIDLPRGAFVLSVIHQRTAPGHGRANYLPTIALLPTAKPDEAGDTRQAAADLGGLRRGEKTSVTGYLQAFRTPLSDGSPGGPNAANDYADWYRITTTQQGKLRSSFSRQNVLESDDQPIALGLIRSPVQYVPEPFPSDGVDLAPGTYYVTLGAPVDIVREFGVKYRLDIALD